MTSLGGKGNVAMTSMGGKENVAVTSSGCHRCRQSRRQFLCMTGEWVAVMVLVVQHASKCIHHVQELKCFTPVMQERGAGSTRLPLQLSLV